MYIWTNFLKIIKLGWLHNFFAFNSLGQTGNLIPVINLDNNSLQSSIVF